MLPAFRQSYGRSRRRRSHHALKPITPSVDPLTGMAKLHHRAAKDSGYVRAGLQIKVPKLGIGVAKS
jgi:large subunit ribosomal protein L32